MNGMNTGATGNEPNEPMTSDTWNSESARVMAELGWHDDGPKLWKSASGGVRLTDIESGLAGDVAIRLTPRLTITVDRLSPDRLTGIEIAGQWHELDAAERSTLAYIAGDEFSQFISSGGEGLLPFELPSLPAPVQHLALAASLAQLLHPIFALDAALLLSTDSNVADASRRLAKSASPFVDALREAVVSQSTATPTDGSGFEAVSVLLNSLANGAQAPGSARDQVERAGDVRLDADVIRQIAAVPLSPTSTAADARNPDPAARESIAEYDLVEVDDVQGATAQSVGDELVVAVETEGTSEAIFGSTVDRTGRLGTAEVIFERGSTTGSTVLPRPDGDFWVEIHGSDEPTLERWERAAMYAETAAAQLVAVLQAVGAGRGASEGVTSISAELRALADLYEDVALDPVRAEQARSLVAQLDRGESPFERFPAIRTTELLVAAQPLLQDHLDESQQVSHQSDLLRSLLAQRADTLSTDAIPDFVPSNWPNFVPIDWIVEEFGRSLPETPFPDRALSRSMNSAEDSSHRVELDDAQLDATGISSIVIEFSEQTVTVTVTRDRSRAKYGLRIIEAGEALLVERSENPVADVYVAEFHRAASTVRVELDLGTRK